MIIEIFENGCYQKHSLVFLLTSLFTLAMSSKYEKFDDSDNDFATTELRDVTTTTHSGHKSPFNNGRIKNGFDTIDSIDVCAVEIVTNPLTNGPALTDAAVIDARTGVQIVGSGGGAPSLAHESHDVDLEGKSDLRTDVQQRPPSSTLTRYLEFPEELDQLTPLQKTLRFYLEHVIFRLVSMLLILADFALQIGDLTNPYKSFSDQIWFDTVAFLFVTYFCVEIVLRIYAKG